MKDWLNPEGITAIVLAITLLLSIAKNVAQALGKKDLATKLEGAEAKAATFGRVAGTLVKGVERVKREGKLEPKAITALVETLREENLLAGVEPIVKPIVDEARAAPVSSGETIVKLATARMDPNVVARRVS